MHVGDTFADEDSFDSTGGWGAPWSDVAGRVVALAAGDQAIKLSMVAGGGNVESISLTATNDPASAAPVVPEPPSTVSVTFQVNMDGVDTANGVSVMGGAVFGQAGLEMTDDDADGVYTVTASLASNSSVMFKYRNTSASTWDNQESVATECANGEWGDRLVNVGTEDATLDVVGFGLCTDVLAPEPEPEPAAGITIDESGAFYDKTHATWVKVIDLALKPDGASTQSAKSLSMNVTELPEGGANYRVYKTIANGSDYFAPAQALALGANDINVGGTSFDRSVKIQLSSGAVRFDSLVVNGTTVYPAPAAPVDTDGDGVADADDAFPNDDTESVDSDGDGVGDNADYAPNDATVQVEPVVTNDNAQIAGDWRLAPEAGALGVGGSQGDIGWWSNNDGDVQTRYCLFDDVYSFNGDDSLSLIHI